MKKTFFIILLLLLLLFSSPAEAQTRPQPLVTWSSNSYVPPGFLGKALPSPGSVVRAALMVIEASAVVDISQKEIKWYLDGEEFKTGVGLQQIEFTAPNMPGEFLKVRAQIANLNSETISKTVEIPIARPEAVISTHFPGNDFSSTNLKLRARAFFFNIQDQSFLSFSWKVNRQDPNPSNDPSELTLSLPGVKNGYKVQINLKIDNDSPAESASLVRNLIYRK